MIIDPPMHEVVPVDPHSLRVANHISQYPTLDADFIDQNAPFDLPACIARQQSPVGGNRPLGSCLFSL